MFTLSMTESLDMFAAGLNDIERNNIPFVTAFALTKTAQDVKEAEIDAMRLAFDRPTRFTLNALQVTPATKRDLRAAVVFKISGSKAGGPAARYLGPEVEGGGRAHKSHERRLIAQGIMKANEYAVPTRLAPLDAYGNMKGGTIERILSDVGSAEQWAGYTANATAKTRARKRRSGKGMYFAVRGQGGLPAGIYFRLGLRDIRPIILFVRAPVYAKRLPFYETAERVVDARFPVHFADGWRRFGQQRRPT